MKTGCLALVAILAVLAGTVAAPGGAAAKPAAKAKVDRSRLLPQINPRRLYYRPRYYRRLRPEVVRRALSSDGPSPQVSPKNIPGH